MLDEILSGPGESLGESFDPRNVLVKDSTGQDINLKMALISEAVTVDASEVEAAKNKIDRAYQLNPEAIRALVGKSVAEAKTAIEAILATERN